MIKIILTVDPTTQRAMYADECKVLGVFADINTAVRELGDEIIRRFCSIRTV